MAGFSKNAAIWLAAVTAAAQSVGVCLGILFIERVGRRILTLCSLAMVVVSLVFLGTGFYLYDESTGGSSGGDDHDDGSEPSSTGLEGWLVVGAMMAYLLTFGIGMSSIPWTVNAEIYPNHARSLGTSASTTTNWLGNVVVSATFLTLASDDVLGKEGAFWLYASIGVVGWIWLFRTMPETKELSLEEIGRLFDREGDPARPGERQQAGNGTGRGGSFSLLEDIAGAGSNGVSPQGGAVQNADLWVASKGKGGMSEMM